jgi:hypothetical protein
MNPPRKAANLSKGEVCGWPDTLRDLHKKITHCPIQFLSDKGASCYCFIKLGAGRNYPSVRYNTKQSFDFVFF